jgi:hypothetical protein
MKLIKIKCLLVIYKSFISNLLLIYHMDTKKWIQKAGREIYCTSLSTIVSEFVCSKIF